MLWNDVNVIYQVYPRSFKDASGDGIGDLSGIIDKLDYFKGTSDSLGVDAVWLSPFYPSPMKDFGYDVSDYKDVDPTFGSLDDFKRLIAKAHSLDIKVMLDYVPNHTSDAHPWFVDSMSSRENSKRDWYIWRDPKPDGSPPNNWLSVFGGSAWQFHEPTGQYYLHSFLSSQPDLNWDNPDVKKEMLSVLDFWLELGADGIRVDAVNWIAKDPQLRDDPVNSDYKEDSDSDPYHAVLHSYSKSRPHLLDYLRLMTNTVRKYDDRIIVFEMYPEGDGNRVEQYDVFYHSIDHSVGAPFLFEGLYIDYRADVIRDFINSYQLDVGFYHRMFYCFSNHDQPRIVTRFGLQQAKLIAAIQLTLPGIPVMYYGDELGMENGVIPDHHIQDSFEKLTPNRGLGRDPQRTPMQWNSGANAGFSEGEPWLPVADTYKTNNVEMERFDDASFWVLYRQLLRLRSEYSQLRNGSSFNISSEDLPKDVVTYYYELPDSKLVVYANISSENNKVKFDKESDTLLVSTHEIVMSGEDLDMQPHQAVVFLRS